MESTRSCAASWLTLTRPTPLRTWASLLISGTHPSAGTAGPGLVVPARAAPGICRHGQAIAGQGNGRRGGGQRIFPSKVHGGDRPIIASGRIGGNATPEVLTSGFVSRRPRPGKT